MNLAEIEQQVAELDVAQGFDLIYDLLLAYGFFSRPRVTGLAGVIVKFRPPTPKARLHVASFADPGAHSMNM